MTDVAVGVLAAHVGSLNRSSVVAAFILTALEM
jgi:hypothetical protein